MHRYGSCFFCTKRTESFRGHDILLEKCLFHLHINSLSVRVEFYFVFRLTINKFMQNSKITIKN